MFKANRIMLLILLSICSSAVAECDTAVNVEGAIGRLRQFIAEHQLTDNDKTMIKTIVNARLEGIMIKIAPNFSENGNATFKHIITQVDCLGGFGSLKGIAYGVEGLKLLQ